MPIFNGAWPPFDIDGGPPAIFVRGLADTGLLAAFGALLFGCVVLPRCLACADPQEKAAIGRRILRWAQTMLALAWLAVLAWLVVASGAMADAAGVRQTLAAVPDVLTSTVFGLLVAGQLALLAAAAALLGRGGSRARQWAATCCAGLVAALQAAHGHALAMNEGPSLLLLAGVGHLLAAGAWLGGLPPLLLVVRHGSPMVGAAAARWFTPLGKLCIGLLAASASWQFWVLIGGLPGLVGSAYGWVAGVKLLLLIVLIGFACLNRYRLAPALRGAGGGGAKSRLQLSIVLQTGGGLLVLLAAAVISSLPPAMHIQPVWPFTRQFSLITVGEDPEFRREVIVAASAVGAAGLLLVGAAFLRRFARWAVAAAALGLAGLAVPHFDLLLVAATPTSFYRAPAYGGGGADLYETKCAVCHGAAGNGDGPLARQSAVPAADLNAEHLWAHSDGELFWWLSHGIDAPDGRQSMPGFAASLNDDQIWALIGYIRAHNAALTSHPPMLVEGQHHHD